MPPSKFLGVRLPKDLAELAKAAADEDNRTLSNYIRDLVIKDIRSRQSTGDLSEPRETYKVTAKQSTIQRGKGHKAVQKRADKV